MPFGLALDRELPAVLLGDSPDEGEPHVGPPPVAIRGPEGPVYHGLIRAVVGDLDDEARTVPGDARPRAQLATLFGEGVQSVPQQLDDGARDGARSSRSLRRGL